MDKGWGLTLNSSDPPFTTSPSSSSLPYFLKLDPHSHHHHHHPLHPQFNLVPMAADSVRMFPFSVGLPSKEDPPPPPSRYDNNRLVLGEVDFFSDKKRTLHRNDDDDDDGSDRHVSKAASVSVKKENSDAQPLPSSSHVVNTGLHLLTTNTGSDQSTVDDGVSSHDDKRSQIELAQLQVELQRMNVENQTLREMLGQVANNYSALQMHLVALMQQHHQTQAAQTSQQHKLVDVKTLEEKKPAEVVVPRQFLDLGPPAETDEISHSSSDERTHSASPPNNMEAGSVKSNGKHDEMGGSYDQEHSSFRDAKRTIGREESPESESPQGCWNPNKAQKLNSATKSFDQSTEATMRKAHVSVRARSEAPMISDGCQWGKYGQKTGTGLWHSKLYSYF